MSCNKEHHGFDQKLVNAVHDEIYGEYAYLTVSDETLISFMKRNISGLEAAENIVTLISKYNIMSNTNDSKPIEVILWGVPFHVKHHLVQ